MAKDIEPKLREIGDYLKLEEDAVFFIPEYQRPYSWNIANCDKLWQDIVDFTGNNNSKDNYFFGTIIINCRENDTIHELIDGQQRTTTFLLLLKALLFRINSLICKMNNDDDESLGLLGGLKQRRRDILRVLYKAEAEEISDRPNEEKDTKIYEKLNLLQNVSNNEQFKDELNTILKASCFDEAEKNVHKIPYKQKDNRYTNFFRNLKFFWNKIQALEANEVNAIAKSIIEKCEVIEIKSWKVEQAITMFNSLNSDGMPLNDADIISAKLFATSKSLGKDIEFSNIWKELLEQIGDLNEIIDINSILTQYMYLLRAKDSKMGADTTVPGVRRYFTEINRQNLIEKPIETCSKMLRLSKIWAKIINYPIIAILLKCNENAKLFLGCYFNRFLDNDNDINETEIIMLAETLLRLFVVLELVDAGYSSKYFKSYLFKEAIKLTDKNIPIKEISNDFDSHIIENWRDQSDIESRIKDYDKNLLVYVNEYLFAREKSIDFILKSKCDIEHIMPASGHNLIEIRKDAGIKDENEFNSVVNKLGNKILLEEKINRSIGNEWFRTKVSNTSAGKFSYVNSTYPIAQSLVKCYRSVNKPFWEKKDIEIATQKATNRILKFIFNNS